MNSNGRPTCHDLRKYNGWLRIRDSTGTWWGLVCSLDCREAVQDYLKAASGADGVIEQIILPPGVLPEEEPLCPCFRKMKFKSKKY
jgi:hypothetical protein